jgi:predicted phage terminase large subunit-like protein
MISRYLAPHFMGEFPGREIMLVSHSAPMAETFSEFARDLISTERYQDLYDYAVSKNTRSKSAWSLENGMGKTYWAGIGTGISGKGLDCGIIDDYFGDRAKAESETERQQMFEWFGDVFMSRCAPVVMVFILATRWHVDDLIGRIINRNTPGHVDYNPDFPKFEVLKFPAGIEPPYLFPERFSETWYRSAFAAAGKYGTASLYQCEPYVRGGNVFEVNKIKVVDSMPSGLVWKRAWDLASTDKELNKSDPDYTVGALVAVRKIKNEAGVLVDEVYVKDIRRRQAKAPERDRLIKSTAELDGPIPIGIEGVAGYLDTVENIRDHFRGSRVVVTLEAEKDKTVRAQCLEPVVEAGNFHIQRAEWNMSFIDEMAAFPNGAHDDQIDAVVHGYNMGKQMMDFSRLGPIVAKVKDNAEN